MHCKHPVLEHLSRGLGKMSWSIKCLSYKLEDLSSVEKPSGCHWQCVQVILVLRRERQEDPRSSLASKSDQNGQLQVQRETKRGGGVEGWKREEGRKKKSGKQLRKTPTQHPLLASTGTHISICKHIAMKRRKTS